MVPGTDIRTPSSRAGSKGRRSSERGAPSTMSSASARPMPGGSACPTGDGRSRRSDAGPGTHVQVAGRDEPWNSCIQCEPLRAKGHRRTLLPNRVRLEGATGAEVTLDARRPILTMPCHAVRRGNWRCPAASEATPLAGCCLRLVGRRKIPSLLPVGTPCCPRGPSAKPSGHRDATTIREPQARRPAHSSLFELAAGAKQMSLAHYGNVERRTR